VLVSFANVSNAADRNAQVASRKRNDSAMSRYRERDVTSVIGQEDQAGEDSMPC
jgi:hypothetical protein